MQIQVGVKALIQNQDGLYLFIERRQKLADGGGIRWDIPGGRIQSGETLVAALAREIEEEVGLQLTGPVELLGAQDIISKPAGLHVVRLTYQVQAGGTLSLSDEHQQYKWLSLAEALELQVDDYLRQVLQKL